MKSMPEIMELTNEAWTDMPRNVFESAWMICGYFGPEHFLQFQGVHSVSTEKDAQKVLDPCGVLHGAGLTPTPQYCTRFEWQLQVWK